MERLCRIDQLGPTCFTDEPSDTRKSKQFLAWTHTTFFLLFPVPLSLEGWKVRKIAPPFLVLFQEYWPSVMLLNVAIKNVVKRANDEKTQKEGMTSCAWWLISICSPNGDVSLSLARHTNGFLSLMNAHTKKRKKKRNEKPDSDTAGNLPHCTLMHYCLQMLQQMCVSGEGYLRANNELVILHRPDTRQWYMTLISCCTVLETIRCA